MFFEPLPAGEETFPAALPESPPWSGPSALESGAVLAVDQTVARSANVVVQLPTIRAFRQGCMLDVDVISRQGDLSEDDFWELHMSAHAVHRVRGGPLPRRLLRLGVRFADGSKATTLESRLTRRRQSRDEPPDGPLLSFWPSGSGMRGRQGDGMIGFSSSGLWLWPLPPAEDFEFAVEWPVGGIELTIIELDGAAIAAAASRSRDFWPATDGDTEG